ncbi:uncharacterized protein LOC129602483 [Paramacrobiotus metropolitanus]|uniref:uncharacterized protein LOC129602483 n=1 Tax=Paramacrobiotus metropolitanus TaxID=2943436 RepID=UPI0024459291|nr:uncharacterized protein LOC129602483 [Paramacrobiotus metropolitanus]
MYNSGIRPFNHTYASAPCEIYPGSNVYQWNAVDVQNADGLLERGLVINTVHRGLLVDFGVSDRRSQFVEFKKALLCLSADERCLTASQNFAWESNAASQTSCHVLARTAADRPWTWYPAVFLLHRVFWNKYAYIQIHMGDEVVWKFVRAQVVRLAHRDSTVRRTAPADFVVRACTLPREYLTERPVAPALWSLWEEGLMSQRVYKAYPIGVVNESLLYLQDRCRLQSSFVKKVLPISKDLLHELNERAKAEMAKRLQTGWNNIDGQWVPPRICAPLRTIPAQKSRQLAASCPPELLREILSCLSTNVRPFYRRVSPLWNEIIQQADCSRYLTLDFGSAGPSATYTAGVCIIQCLTAATRMIVIISAQQNYRSPELTECLRLVSVMYEQCANRIRKLQVKPKMIVRPKSCN